MIPVSQIQKGLVIFIDNEITPAFSGWQKVVIGGAAGLVASKLPQIINQYANHPFVSALGLYDASSNSVDIESLYNAFVPKLDCEKIPISLPVIGTIKMGRNEFDALMAYIQEV